MPSIKKLASCARPLLYKLDSVPGAPYQLGGSCFVCSFRGEHFVVTTRHCIAKTRPENVLVPYHPAKDHFLALQMLSTVKRPATQPLFDCTDIAVFLVRRDRLETHCLPQTTVLDIEPLMQAPVPISPSAHFVLRGYPFELRNEIDYVSKKITRQALTVNSQYFAPDSQHIHQVQFYEDYPLDRIDGMSGCPVFQILGTPGTASCFWSFAGMILGDWARPKIGVFVEYAIIFQVILNVSKELRPLERDEEIKYRSARSVAMIYVPT